MGLPTPRASPGPSSPLPDAAGIDLADYCSRRLAGLETGSIPNIGPGAAAAIWTLFATSTIFLTLRIYCKIWRSRGLWWDDLVLIISWAMFLASTLLCHRVITHGFGKYPCDIPPQNLPLIAFEGAGLGSAFTILAIVWSKTSFGITILRLTRDGLRRFVLVVVVAMNVAMLLQAVFVWVKCEPVEKNWRPLVEGRCWDLRFSNGYGFFSGVLSGVCDVLFALLPWHLVWGLRMRKKEKVGVVVAMSMGVFAGATAFVKSVMLLSLGSKNFTHEGAHLITWAAAEIATTIMASCIPFLRVLFRELRDTHPTEISGAPGRRYYQFRKSSSTGETMKYGMTSPINTTVLATGDNPADTTEHPPSQAGAEEAKPSPKPWTSCWDFGKTKRVSQLLTGKFKSAAEPAVRPYPIVENSSQRELVDVAGKDAGGDSGRTEGVILQMQQFELRYEGPGKQGGSEGVFELGKVGIGEAC